LHQNINRSFPLVFLLQALYKVQEFLKVPVRKLVSRHVKIHTRPLPQQVDNWNEILEALNGTEYAHFLNHADYDS
jgi:hypothetical protein